MVTRSPCAARAAQGDLVTMVGADTAAWERCLPVFETFSSLVVRAGGVGAGQQAKLLNNAMLTAHLGIAADAFDIGDRLGVDRSALADVIARGSGRSFGAEMLVAHEGLTGVARSQARPTLGKDIRLLLELLDDAPEAAIAESDAVLIPAARRTIHLIEALGSQ
jgi:3-hydroxyisobutyrate dehydrogenase-like beta-hydroxyacid dehydrogenase